MQCVDMFICRLAVAAHRGQFEFGLFQITDHLAGKAFCPNDVLFRLDHTVLQADQVLFANLDFPFDTHDLAAQIGDDLLTGGQHVAVQQHDQQHDCAKTTTHDVEECQVEL